MAEKLVVLCKRVTEAKISDFKHFKDCCRTSKEWILPQVSLKSAYSCFWRDF